ncbi:patatin-like phospholipase family protein [Ornithinimicrobium sp. F0845]|uniref:patatin-like phospholipase family protein n=1 Tax=Ornithinimicrobium sp. F0845 TaxID=2926412 RepID=UPI001FF1B794|nr:patatin-like phospholipase family protein [Ornithinimicrobium sp. F0845]MCK0110925.1 patatin-like phospholipase family protein [Ornithinimicrobium sp. F0845]
MFARHPGRSAAPEPERAEVTPVLGLALGGGGARGLCHIGVVRVLEELGVTPDVVSGTSMGGLIGAFIAAGYSAEQMAEIATDLRWSRLIDWSPLSGRLVNTKGLERWMAELLPPTFEELELPLVLTATDLNEGRIYYSQHGDLIRALRATTAYPGALEPVRAGSARLVDGGLLNQTPVDGALFLGAHRVLAVNATPLSRLDQPEDDARAPRKRVRIGAVGELLRAVDVMQSQLTMARLSFYKPDVLLDPLIAGVEIADFHKAKLAIQAGEDEARNHVDELRTLLGPRRAAEPEERRSAPGE